jgi:Family of unknown function (DUF6116)
MMIGRLVTRFASGLRFPTLFKIVAALFVLDFFIPDLVPFYDEILLALGTLLLGSLKTRKVRDDVIDGEGGPAR